MLPKRKQNRLRQYDYSRPGAYFITICTQKRENHFWDMPVGVSIARPQDLRLNKSGEVVDKAIQSIPIVYPAISIDYYVIMPNHVHILMQIHSDGGGRAMLAPTVEEVVRQMKGHVTKKIGKSIWQKGFHDHVVRNRAEYEEIARYIDDNPTRWIYDRYYNA